MATGIMLTFFDFRNDVRKLISEMVRLDDIIVFIRPEHESLIQAYTDLGFQYRLIDEASQGFVNTLAHYAFTLFRQLPASRQNYFLMEQFKSDSLPAVYKKKSQRLLQAQKILPKTLSYDAYLNMLNFSGRTDLSGISKMIVWTEVYDDHLFARCVRTGVPTAVYVYSWDHACKHVRFSKRVSYFVWHAGIAEDLQQLQHIDAQRIDVTGSTQLGFIDTFRQRQTTTPLKQNVIYYGCGVGIQNLIPEEIRCIILLAECMRQVLPDHVLMVRPYPNCRDWSVYDGLRALPNVQFDDQYRQNDLSVEEEAILQKFERISTSKAFFHTGTTLGLEACFTDTPSFLLDLSPDNGNAVSMYHFVHQYQNQKYLIDAAPQQVVTQIDQLMHILSDLDDPDHMTLHAKVQATFRVHSFAQIAKNILTNRLWLPYA